MTRKKLRRFWKEAAAYRRALPKISDLEALAKLCGREPYPGAKHQMWRSTVFAQHRAFPIPRHGGNPTASFAVRDTVLDHLEMDAAAFEDLLPDDDDDAGVKGGGN